MFIEELLLCFIPVFVAVDALGVLPIFISLTEGMGKKQKKKIIMQSVVTAFSLAIVFIFLGKIIFNLLGITMGDFMIAGGVVLFSIAIIDLLNPVKKTRIPDKELGSVPLGIPLIVGPAVLTTSLILVDQHGILATLLSVVINVFIAGFTFYSSGVIINKIGVAGSRALSKITSLLLAAIAVMLIRKGVFTLFYY